MRPRFCAHCAGSLEWRRLEGERLPQPVCALCGRVAWQNPKPTASALITRRGPSGIVDVLLVRRAVEPCRGHWDCPGGFVDPDEHPEQTVRREMREELGIDVEITRFVGIFMDRYGDEGESTLNVYYEAAIVGGAISPASDVGEAAWFPLDRLPEPIAFANNRAALRALGAGR
jgi:ADP-ribose pyrophosphatase YjhB (NUDIX family)